MMDPRNQSPFNTLPPVVVSLAVVVMGVELMFQAGSAGIVGGAQGVGWRLTALRDWAISDVVWNWMVANRTFPPIEMARFLAYPLLHGSMTHAVFVAVFVLALGNAIAPVYRGVRVLAIFFGAAVLGALGFLLMFDTQQPLFGGYPGAYGLIGAFTYLTQRGLTRADPARAFLLIGFLLALQPIFAAATLFDPGRGFSLAWLPDWIADMTGAAGGYGIAVLLFPGMIGHLRDRLRQR